jgi:hypothetical protein
MEKIKYKDYSFNVKVDTNKPNLFNKTYQNRQKYLIAWTQKS